MKALFKLGSLLGLACLGCGALQATEYLVTIQAENGQYLCAENGGGSTVVANRYYAGSWETFVIDDSRIPYYDGWYLSIRSTENPKFLCWNNPQSTQYYTVPGYFWYTTYNTTPNLVINRDYAGSWERFDFVDPWGAGSPKPMDSGYIYTKIRNYGYTYLQAINGGGGAVGGMGGDYNSTNFLGLNGWTGTRFAITVLAVL